MEFYHQQQVASHAEGQQATSILDPRVLGPLMRGVPADAGRGARALACRAAAAAARRACTRITAPGRGVAGMGAQAGAEALAHIAARFASLTLLRLRLSGCTLEVTWHLLSQLTTLRELDLSHSYLTESDMDALASALPALTRLERLALSSCHMPSSTHYEEGARVLGARLPELPRLRALELGDNYLGVEGVLALAPALAALQLNKLDLWHTHSGAGDERPPRPEEAPPGLPDGHDPGEALAAALMAAATALEWLDLGLNGIGSLGAATIAPALESLTRVSRLSLAENHLGANGAAAIAPAISQLTRLKDLNLGYTDLGASGAAALAPALMDLSGLTFLALSGCRIEARGAEALPLLCMGQLRELRLDGNQIAGDKAWAALAVALQFPSHLSSLDLSHNGLDKRAAFALKFALPKLASARASQPGRRDTGQQPASEARHGQREPRSAAGLRLASCGIDAAVIKALAPGLAHLPRFAALDLSENPLGPAGEAAFAPALPALTHLTELRLVGCGIGDGGAASIAPGLAAKTSLRVLLLGDNRVGMAALAPAIGRLRRLQSLNLSSNPLGPAGAAALATALPRLTECTKLGVDSCGIDARGVAALAPGLSALPSLKSLTLGWNEIGREGVATLAACYASGALPALSFLFLQDAGLVPEGQFVLDMESAIPELWELTRISDLVL